MQYFDQANGVSHYRVYVGKQVVDEWSADLDLVVDAPGFQKQKKTGITIDADAAVRLDVLLSVAQQSQEITVSEAGASVSTQVETTATHLGEVVAAA